jgi:hypothetical protein
LLLIAVVCAACSQKGDEQKTTRKLTQAQRDSAIAASKLPGAGVVGKALEVADTAEARASKQDASIDE